MRGRRRPVGRDVDQQPAFGVGNYIATMPLALRERAQITAVELDKVSSQIAAYLHPDVQLFGG